MSYWQDRMTKAQDNLTQKNIKDINNQMLKYYQSCYERVIDAFINTFDSVMIAEVLKDRQPTPADLYKLDSYWKMQAQLKEELQKMGDKQIALLSKQFEKQFIDIYNTIAIPSQAAYSTVNKTMVKQIVNQVWAADGKAWSDRVWKNTGLLADTLNEELIHCVVTGRDNRYLKEVLKERFNVSYNRADTLVRTELSHLQTQAAQQRYLDAGIKEVQVWADKDERRCEKCGKLHKKKYLIGAQMPIPAHPKCRCCIVPVIE